MGSGCFGSGGLTWIDPRETVNLAPLMERTSGSPEVVVALIDGPVATSHPGLAGLRFRNLLTLAAAEPAQGAPSNGAFQHGTFTAGILCARRDSGAPGIAPDCTLLLRPVFAEQRVGNSLSARGSELASAIAEVVEAGARIINLSIQVTLLSWQERTLVTAALQEAARREIPVVVAAGNEGAVRSDAITGYPWVTPVMACNLQGSPLGFSNVGRSLGRRGVAAPGAGVRSLAFAGGLTTGLGTSVAAPFVTGTLALLASLFPTASGTTLRQAVLGTGPRRGLVPPLLDAGAALRWCDEMEGGRLGTN
jgi:subtilisin family serine protease